MSKLDLKVTNSHVSVAEGISRWKCIPTVAWLLRSALVQIHNDKEENAGQKDVKMCVVS